MVVPGEYFFLVSTKLDTFYSAPQCSHCKRCTSYGNSVCLSVCPSVRPSARWKARVEFLLSVIELLFLSLAVEALQGKCVKTRCYQEGVGQFERRFQGEGVVLGEYFLVSATLETFCY